MSKQYKKKYTKYQVLEAIQGSGSIISTIARRLGCQWDTARKYINLWEETKQAYANEEETIIDLAQASLINSIKDGNTQDAKWYLSKKAKDRGFGDTLELDQNIQGDIKISFVDKE